MKALTLNDYIDKKIKKDRKFTAHYAREQIINRIAEMIIEARRKAHLTQAALAKKIGTTQSVVARMESGQGTYIPSLGTLIRVASALNVNLTLQWK